MDTVLVIHPIVYLMAYRHFRVLKEALGDGHFLDFLGPFVDL